MYSFYIVPRETQRIFRQECLLADLVITMRVTQFLLRYRIEVCVEGQAR